MTEFSNAKVKISRLIELLKTSGGLVIDAEVVSPSPQATAAPSPIFVNFSGEDAALFERNDGELLRAVHEVAAAALGLEGADHELLWFDVDHLRTIRQGQMQRMADSAVAEVKSTQRAHSFAPMPSCERYMLHRALRSSGLRSASEGEGAGRRVVLYPVEISLRENGQALRPSSGDGRLREAS